MSRYSDSSLMSGLGRRRRVHRARGILSELVGSLGLGRRRIPRRRRVGGRRVNHRGKGLFDIIGKVLPFVKKSGIVGHLAGMIPGVGGIAGSAARALGYGRRRRVHQHSLRHRGLGSAYPIHHLAHLANGCGKSMHRPRRVRRHVGHGILL